MRTSESITYLSVAACLLIGISTGLFAAAIQPPEGATAAPTRMIAVEVSVTSDGKPVQGVGFVMRTEVANATAVTNANGQARLEAAAPLSSRMVAVFPSAVPLLGPADRKLQRLTEKQIEVIAPFAFERWYRVSLTPDSNAYQLPIHVSRARNATLRVTDTTGGPIEAFGLSRDVTLVNQLTPTDSDGTLVIRGLPQGRKSVVYILTKDGRIRRVEVPAGQNNVSLGDVVVEPDPPADCEIKIESHGIVDRHWRPETTANGVTLVSLDGSRYYTMQIGQLVPHAVFDAGSRDLPRVAPGVYYVVGGLFKASVEQVAVIERALSGEDLRPLGVPTVTAVPGVLSELRIDPWQVEKLILGPENTDKPNALIGE